MYDKNLSRSDVNYSEILLKASIDGDIAKTILAIKNGADVNYKDVHGSTALMSACIIGNITIVKLLLDKGADINLRDNQGNTALFSSILYNRGNFGIIELLLQQKNKNAFMLQESINMAENLNNQKIIELFHKYGIFKEELNKFIKNLLLSTANEEGNGNTLNESDYVILLNCVYTGNFEGVKGFLQRGANINFEDKKGITALGIAASTGNTKMVKFLLENGANANYNGGDMKSPIIQAIAKGYLEIIKLLIDYGADPDSQCDPILLAYTFKHTDVLNFFKERKKR